MTEIQGKSILVRVSARFKLARVRVIGSRLHHNTYSQEGDNKYYIFQTLGNLLQSTGLLTSLSSTLTFAKYAFPLNSTAKACNRNHPVHITNSVQIWLYHFLKSYRRNPVRISASMFLNHRGFLQWVFTDMPGSMSLNEPCEFAEWCYIMVLSNS